MRRKNVTGLTDQELVDRFIDIAVAQEEALYRYGSYDKLFWDMEAVELELKSRPGDRRRALLPLHQHANVQGRLKAATATLAIAPVESRAVLQAIVDRKQFPQAGEAGMRLWNIDQGVFKPT